MYGSDAAAAVPSPPRRAALALLALAVALAGCAAAPPGPATPEPDLPPGVVAYAHRASGAPAALPGDVPRFEVASPDSFAPSPARALQSGGAFSEPTLGVTSDGALYYLAWDRLLRSDDGGRTWRVASTLASSPMSMDPFLHVDPDTDRVFTAQLYLEGACSYVSWSDDGGASWQSTPLGCGRPLNDHPKLATAPARGPLPTLGYPNVVVYAYNADGGGSRASLSHDGGRTWPFDVQTVPPGGCDAGLHGALLTTAQGALLLPKRDCEGFTLARSEDAGHSWTAQRVGEDAGGAECRKNPDLAQDRAGHVYGVWAGRDDGLHLSVSRDDGRTWSARSLRATPDEVAVATMPAVVAGDAGRVAVVYYGTAAEGRGPDEVPEDAQWHLWATWSLDALADDPACVTLRVTDDPVQVGPIDTNSECDAPAGSRNLLDFLDALVEPSTGRLLAAYTDGCVDGCARRPSMEASRASEPAFAASIEGLLLAAPPR